MIKTTTVVPEMCECGGLLEICIHENTVTCFIDGEEITTEEMRGKEFKRVSVKETIPSL